MDLYLTPVLEWLTKYELCMGGGVIAPGSAELLGKTRDYLIQLTAGVRDISEELRDALSMATLMCCVA